MIDSDTWRTQQHKVLSRLAEAATRSGVRIVCAESCTGGWLAKLLTDLPGSSTWFEGGVVTYSNRAKQELLGVDAGLLREHGAVSEPVARAMVRGLSRFSEAQLGVAITGIAGPDGGSEEKPLGSVWLAWGWSGKCVMTAGKVFDGDRDAVRRQAVLAALSGLCKTIDNSYKHRQPEWAPKT